MPVDLSNPTGFNRFWQEVVGRFRSEAVDDPMDGGNLDALEDHITGPVTADQLRAQNAYPFAWSVPRNHSPAYATVTEDQGTLQIQVVIFAADADPELAFEKARVLAGRVVDNVEGSALVGPNGKAAASQVSLQNFQMDFQASPGDSRAQTRTAQTLFGVEVERDAL